jgi:hypothetical protein
MANYWRYNLFAFAIWFKHLPNHKICQVRFGKLLEMLTRLEISQRTKHTYIVLNWHKREANAQECIMTRENDLGEKLYMQ